MKIKEKLRMKRPGDDIIDMVLADLASAEEAELVALWFSTDEGQQYLSERMSNEFFSVKEGFEELNVPHEIPAQKIWEKIDKNLSVKKKHSSKRSARIYLRIAVVLIPVLFIVGFLMQLSTKVDLLGTAELKELYIPKGERSQITLCDGTKVYLNSGSTFKYPEKFGLFSRNVSLDGEAYFEVVKSSRRTFVVQLNNAKIEVLGTSFNVKAYSKDEKVDIALDKGRIDLISSANKRYQLYPQELLAYNNSTKEVSISKSQQTSDASSWREEIIIFKNTLLKDVIETLNRRYDVEFIVLNNKALEYSYTLTSEKATLKEILSDLEKISPLKFAFENDTVTISLK